MSPDPWDSTVSPDSEPEWENFVNRMLAVLPVLALAVGLAPAASAEGEYELGLAAYDEAAASRMPDALRLIEGAAEDGYALADAFIGLLHDKGDGMMVPHDPALAVARYERAAEGNNCAALKRLAQAYGEGKLDVEPDADRAAAYAARVPECVRR
jgi:TPR repeat protein